MGQGRPQQRLEINLLIKSKHIPFYLKMTSPYAILLLARLFTLSSNGNSWFKNYCTFRRLIHYVTYLGGLWEIPRPFVLFSLSFSLSLSHVKDLFILDYFVLRWISWFSYLLDSCQLYSLSQDIRSPNLVQQKSTYRASSWWLRYL